MPEARVPDDMPPRETWSVIYVGSTRVGYARTRIEVFDFGKSNALQTETENVIVLKRFGQELKSRMHLETICSLSGRLVLFSLVMENPPAAPVISRGQINSREGKITIESITAGNSTTSTVAWDRDIRSPAYQDWMLRNPPLQPGEERKFRTFLPEFGQVADVVAQGRKSQPIQLWDGTTRELLQADIVTTLKLGGKNQEIPFLAFLNEAGETIVGSMSLGDLTLLSYEVPREEALKSIAGAELDLALDTLVPVSLPNNPHLEQKAVYQITIRHEEPDKLLPSGPTQEIQPVPSYVEKATATIHALRPGYAPLGETAWPSPEYLVPTRFLQSDDPRVVALAQEFDPAESDPWTIATGLEKLVHDRLTKKNFSTALASAAEVAESLSGDCTEHACLLAALCRARKIPSRIVVGLVYVPSLESFGGHMWTEVFVERQWIPLDATLGQGGIGVGHIKFSDSSFADDGPTPISAFLPLMSILGKIEIEAVSVE